MSPLKTQTDSKDECKDCYESPCDCDPTDQERYVSGDFPTARELQVMGLDKEPWNHE